MKTQPTFEKKFKGYLRASYPLLYIRTHEEGRVLNSIINIEQNAANAPVQFYSWDVYRQLEKYTPPVAGAIPPIPSRWDKVPGDYGLTSVISNIKKLGGGQERHVFVLRDFHHYISDAGQIRAIRNAVGELKGKGSMIVFVSPVLKIPTELERDIQLLDFSLPTAVELEGILINVSSLFNKRCEEKNEPKPVLSLDIKQAAIEALKGLSFNEAHDACSLAITEHMAFDKDFLETIFEEKVKQVKRNGLLQYMKPDITFENIGGMEGLKKWIRIRAKSYSSKAREYGLPFSKGILLCGPPGVGKSIVAKATANELGFPLFQLDIGGLFGSKVGETEQNFRKVTETIDGVGQCVLFID